MACTADRLYQLLPAIYRIRDAEYGQPLRALVAVVAEQAAVMEADIGRLYENWFIETCEEWVTPYIGDLLGVRGLHQVTSATFSHRARVANTLGYRRRKGTASMLEQLARDTTGWPARVVELFQLLATTQHVNHVRPQNVRTPDLRQANALDLLDGPFDTIAHTADVRHIDTGRGTHNIMNVGTFFWRLRAYPIDHAPAFPHGAGRFSFSQLGQDMPLFTHPVTESDPSHPAGEIDVPAPIRRLGLQASLESSDELYYGGDLSLRIWIGPDEIPRQQIVACNLTGWRHRPERGRVAVDPALGRIAFPATQAPDPGTVRVDCYYGASSDVGGGCYERVLSDDQFVRYRIAKDVQAMDSVRKAVDRWIADGAPNAVLEIQDNEVYEEELRLTIPSGRSLEIRASNRRRPVLRLTSPLAVKGGASTEIGEAGGRLTLDGLLLTGSQVEIPDGDLESFEVKHCTLVPGLALTAGGEPLAAGAPSVLVEGGNARLKATVTRTISGGLRLPGIGTLTITDSLIDGTGGPAIQAGTLIVNDSTIFGPVTATLVDCASNSIFTDRIAAVRKQSGCIRFCYLPSHSQVPRRYRCQPDLAIDAARGESRADVQARLHPGFTDTRYGQPGYGQLDARCAVEIATGADDRAEMGAFHHLEQQQRELNFRTSLGEYLRLGLEAGIVHVT
jgi:hypothetical protein